MLRGTTNELWLIGATEMAQDYAEVLKALGVSFNVIGRGSKSSNIFEKNTGIRVKVGGIENSLQNGNAPKTAIIAVGVEQLASVACKLLKSGTSRILLEKPGGLNLEEVKMIHEESKLCQAEVWLGYNRRFYASTMKASELIKNDGGITSFHMEFTEWSSRICNLIKKSEIKSTWFFSNSTHVVDLAFHLCGFPKSWDCWTAGTLDWHKAAARFAGAGITDQGAMFSYIADWEAPGRWGIEIMTRKNRLIFRPMEKLHLIRQGSLTVEQVKIDDRLDREFKPGIYRQTEAFLQNDPSHFCTIEEQVSNAAIYEKIAGYSQK